MLHPQSKAFLDLLVENNAPPTHTLSVADARRFYRDRRSLTQPEPSEVGEVRELSAEGPHGAIPLRFYRPLASEGGVLPVLVFFHGGGWVIGDLDTHDSLCRELANLSGCAVVAVDYRMGPENRFPAAVDDALAATRWVRQEAASLGVDADRLAVGGDSAGGNLAAVVALAARDAGDLPIAFQLLIYPATDLRRGQPSYTTNGQGYGLTADAMRYFHDHYIDDPKHDLDWRASPLLHENLAGLPPALVLTAGYDPLRDDGAAYAEALTAAGNTVSYVCFERQIHGFAIMGRLLDEAHAAVGLFASELRRALKPRG
jgi:acetyl esterase